MTLFPSESCVNRGSEPSSGGCLALGGLGVTLGGLGVALGGLALSLSLWAVALLPWQPWSCLQGPPGTWPRSRRGWAGPGLWGEQQTPLGAAPGPGFVSPALLQGRALLPPEPLPPGDSQGLSLPQHQEGPPAPGEALLCL